MLTNSIKRDRALSQNKACIILKKNEIKVENKRWNTEKPRFQTNLVKNNLRGSVWIEKILNKNFFLEKSAGKIAK